MKICFLGKYPPIEGGVSTCNYWLARALAKGGHKIYIITNAEEAGFEFKEEISPKDMPYLTPPGVKVFNTRPLSKAFIPTYTPFIAQLANLAIEVIRRERADVLYTNYLLPYGIAAFIAKKATGIPWFLDHAGSDITTLFDEPNLRTVFIELFKAADLVVNSPQVKERFIDTKLIEKERLSPFLDNKMFCAQFLNSIFSPKVRPLHLAPFFSRFDKKLPVFTYLGKISPLKKTFAFVKAARELPKGKFYLLFVTDKGRMHVQLRNMLREYGLAENSFIMPFQPPWRIPRIITASTCIVAPESEETPYLPKETHGTKVVLEAMLCGRCAIIGEGMNKKGFYRECKNRKHFLVVDPNNTKGFADTLKLILARPLLVKNIGHNARVYSESKIRLSQRAEDTFIRNLRYTILKATGKGLIF